MRGTAFDSPMKKKPGTPLRPKRSRLVSARNEYPAELGALLGSPPNSGTEPESASQIRHLTMSQQSHNLLKFLNEDRARRKFCDVSVSVGGKLYGAHKVVLAHGSSYFHAELSKNPATTHVTLDHVEDSVFQYLLGFLYTSECAVAERDLPALTEAARFLDMMDILKLLCEEGDTHPANVMQAEVEITSSHLAAGDTDIQCLWDVQSTVSSQQFSTENSLHTDVQQESSAEKERMEGQQSVTTRRSARRRKTPTKYQRDNMEYSVNTNEEKQRNMSPKEQNGDRVEVVGEVVVETQTAKLDVNETSKPAQGDDVADEEEEVEGGDTNEEVATQQKVVEVCVINKSADQQRSDADGTEHQPVGEVGVHMSAAGNKTQQRVYPAGLAPVIIQTSSKKTLKCPKCDKTFDRAGENHGLKSTIMFNTTIVNFLDFRTIIVNVSYMIGGVGLQLTFIVNLLL